MIRGVRRRLEGPYRHRGLGRAAVFLAVALLATAPCDAADWAIGVDGGYFDMSSAQKSAKAIFDGSSGGATVGGFVRLGLGEHFFVGAHGRHFQKDGERVFVADAAGPVFRLGHPLTIRLIPVYGEVGYRFGRSLRWAPYVALGLGATSYRERSDVAGLIETSTATKASGHISVGADFLSGPIRFGAEISYSSVPNTIGDTGVSKVYGEKDVGGLSLLARIAFGSRP